MRWTVWYSRGAHLSALVPTWKVSRSHPEGCLLLTRCCPHLPGLHVVPRKSPLPGPRLAVLNPTFPSVLPKFFIRVWTCLAWFRTRVCRTLARLRGSRDSARWDSASCIHQIRTRALGSHPRRRVQANATRHLTRGGSVWRSAGVGRRRAVAGLAQLPSRRVLVLSLGPRARRRGGRRALCCSSTPSLPSPATHTHTQRQWSKQVSKQW